MIRSFYGCLLFISLIALGGCNEPELNSQWRMNDVVIDGELGDWEKCPLYYDDEFKAAIGVANDEKDLYLRLSTGNRDLQNRIFKAGLTVWFDPMGGTKEFFGIHFPLGVKNFPRSERGKGERSSARENPNNHDDQIASLELLRPDKGERLVLFEDEVKEQGIELKWKKTRGGLFYELKVPLSHSRELFLADISAGNPIGIGFVTGKMDMERKKQSMDSSSSGKGREGRGGKGSGGRGGAMGAGRGEHNPESMEVWIKINLAANASVLHKG